jgi:Type IV secretion-system coupling protein DNA-binding domain
MPELDKRLRGSEACSATMSGLNPEIWWDDGDDLAYLGTRPVYGGMQPVGISPSDRRQHMYVVGASGTGKTTLLRNLILQDIEHGHGVGVIDPHGDLAIDLLDAIPPWRTDHVVYFNPADLEYPIGLNLLQQTHADRRHRVASGVVGAMKSIWRDSWGARMEYILYAAVAALLDCENSSILGIQRMLSDATYRRWVVKHVKDPAVRAFWRNEFESYTAAFLQEAISPIQNKVGQLVMSPPVRHVLGQVRRKIDPRFMMDNGRILIANLSKGLLGDDKANLLGSLLVTAFELAALSRSDIPEGKRRPFFLYIDEFHNFTTDSFATLLSEARKYRLSLTLSHQYLEQVNPAVRPAILANAGTLISFRVGGADAQVLAKEFGFEYTPDRFSSLANFEVLVRPVATAERRQPFAGHALLPLAIRNGRRETVIRRSREKYGSRRQVVEGRIARFMGGRIPPERTPRGKAQDHSRFGDARNGQARRSKRKYGTDSSRRRHYGGKPPLDGP